MLDLLRLAREMCQGSNGRNKDRVTSFVPPPSRSVCRHLAIIPIARKTRQTIMTAASAQNFFRRGPFGYSSLYARHNRRYLDQFHHIGENCRFSGSRSLTRSTISKVTKLDPMAQIVAQASAATPIMNRKGMNKAGPKIKSNLTQHEPLDLCGATCLLITLHHYCA